MAYYNNIMFPPNLYGSPSNVFNNADKMMADIETYKNMPLSTFTPIDYSYLYNNNSSTSYQNQSSDFNLGGTLGALANIFGNYQINNIQSKTIEQGQMLQYMAYNNAFTKNESVTRTTNVSAKSSKYYSISGIDKKC
jgi:hypothetical protein